MTNVNLKTAKKPALRLLQSLKESGTLQSLWILLAQQHLCSVYQSEDFTHLKLLATMTDKCQETLLQFTEFVYTNMEDPQSSRLLPSVSALIQDYHLEPSVAFFISRPTRTLSREEECQTATVSSTLHTRKRQPHAPLC